MLTRLSSDPATSLRRGQPPYLLSLVAAAFAMLLIASPSFAGILAGPIVNPLNGHTYYLLTDNTWTASQAEAITLGGHLATVESAPENQWIFDTFSGFGGTSRALWIGYSDQAVEGTFEWSSGSAAPLVLWSSGQPDNGFPGPDPPGEDYVHMLWPTHPLAGQWNDFQNLANVNGFPLNGVVEVGPINPVPSMYGIGPAALGVGLIGLALAVLGRRENNIGDA